MIRRTKIICTIGPASDPPDMLDRLIAAGMDVARLNFSHGDYEEQFARMERIKAARARSGKAIALMLDTKGPEIRTGVFRDGRIQLKEGAELRIVHADIEGTAEAFSITYKEIAGDVRIGSAILINDGLIELKVKQIEGPDLLCEVVTGGEISNHKSINLPNVDLHLPAITEKDKQDLKFAVDNGVDWIAASFIRKPEDILEIRRVLASYGDREIKICAKIENREGVNNYRGILDVADGVMVARGDLGVGIPAEEVPITQKSIIREAYRNGLPSITATEMLDSMIRNPRPTRAEVSDVANAILDGTSCIMLSGESAIGRYPVEAVKMMDRIARYTEERIPYWEEFRKAEGLGGRNLTNAISHAACTTAMDMGAAAIVSMTHSGRTGRTVSHFRPACPIIATTASERVRNQLAISWGVFPVLIPELKDSDELFAVSMEAALKTGIVQNGDLIVAIGGSPAGMAGTTNTLRAETLGSVITSGRAWSPDGTQMIVGDAAVLEDHRISESFQRDSNYILVASSVGAEDLPLIREARALIVEDDNPESYAVTAAQILRIPILYAAVNAAKLIRDDQMLHLDLEKGAVS